MTDVMHDWNAKQRGEQVLRGCEKADLTCSTAQSLEAASLTIHIPEQQATRSIAEASCNAVRHQHGMTTLHLATQQAYRMSCLQLLF